MLRAFVVHWDRDELPAKIALVESAGHKVVGSEDSDGSRAWEKVKDLGPDVLVVWTTHLPSHGRATAAAVRSQPWGRAMNMLFVEGDPDKLPPLKRRKLQEVLPDAVLVTPKTLGAWLGKVEAALASRGCSSTTAPPSFWPWRSGK